MADVAPPTAAPSPQAPFPLLPALALLASIAGEELLGYQVFGTPPASFPSYVLLLLVQVPLCAVCVLGGPRLSRIFAPHVRPLAAIGTITLTLSTIACTLPGTPPVVNLLGVAGLALLALALKLAVFELLAQLPIHRATQAVLAAVLVYPLLSPIALAQGRSAWLCCAGCLLIGALTWASATRHRTHANVQHDTPTPRFTKPLHMSPAVLTGFCIMWTCMSFLNPLAAYQTLASTDMLALTFGTHLAAALLLGLLCLVGKDSSYAYSFMTVNSVALFAFVLLALLGHGSMIPRALCITVFSLAEYVSLLAIVDLATYTSTNRLRLFGGYFLATRLCTLIGICLGTFDAHMPGVGSPYSLAGLGLSVLMIVASVWLLTEKNLSSFFWGNTPQEIARPAADPAPIAQEPPDMRAIVQRQAHAVAERYKLTPREAQVLELLAMGRSSTFIAEELTVSSNTVRKRVATIYDKCHVHSKQELLTLVQFIETAS